MLNFYNNIKDPGVMGEIDVYDFLDMVKNPEEKIKTKISIARFYKILGDEDDYSEIKAQIPCFTLNFLFNGYKNDENIKEATGFVYLDVDGCTDINFDNPLIFASWLSLSGLGRGILVKVNNLNLNNFKTTYETIGNELNITVDKHANKATQFCIHSYDNELYFNNNSITYQAKEVTTKTPNSVTYLKKKGKVAIEIGNNSKLVYNNIGNIDFKGQDYIFFEEEKQLFAKAWIPRAIPVGKRNEILFSIANQFKALNPMMPNEEFLSFIININRSRCIEPLKDKEVIEIVKKIEANDSVKLNLNNPKRMIYSPKCKWTPNEKRAKTNELNGKRRRKKTMKEIEDCLKNWDKKTQGKVTQKKIAETTGKSIKTIENYYKYFYQMIKYINQL